MSQHAAVAMHKPRGDTRLLDDIVYGLDGYWAILVAHDLKLFPLLAEQPRTLHEMCEALHLAHRPAEALLTVCAAQGLVQVQDHQYALTPLAEAYLLDTSPTYFGAVFDLWIQNAAMSSFAGVKQAVLTNAPQVYGGGDMFKSHEEQAHLARTFTRAMHSNSIGPALVWPDLLDLSPHRVLLDIGGGSGAHCIGATRRWSRLQAIVFDLAPVCEVAEECITQEGLQHRIRTQVGDMWQHPFPAADLHFYGQIYHDWPPEKCQFLTQKSFESLAAGGRVIIHEVQRLLNAELPKQTERALSWLRWAYSAQTLPEAFVFLRMALEQLAGEKRRASTCQYCQQPLCCPDHGISTYPSVDREKIKEILDHLGVALSQEETRLRNKLIHGGMDYDAQEWMSMMVVYRQLRSALVEEVGRCLPQSASSWMPPEMASSVLCHANCQYKTAYPAESFPQDCVRPDDIEGYRAHLQQGRQHPKVLKLLQMPPEW